MTVRIHRRPAAIREHAWREIDRRWSLPVLSNVVDYGGEGDGPVRIPDKQLFENRQAWRHETERVLEVVGKARDPRELAKMLFRDGADRCETAFDLPAVTMGLLNRWEETLDPARDGHGRWQLKNSVLSGNGLVSRPVADWIALAIEHVVRRETKTHDDVDRSWKSKSWAVALTWDIDSAGMYRGGGWLRSVRRATAERNPAAALRCLAEGPLCALGLARDPHDNLDELGDELGREGIAGTFFVQAVRAARLDDYSLRHDARLVRGVRRLRERGHEVGLHGSYATCDRDGAFLGRQRDIARELIGGPMRLHRAHYLRTKGPGDALLCAKSGIAIDCTPGFSEHEGFRLGTAHPVQPWDDSAEAPLPLVVVPLHAMDVTLKHHRRLSPDGALEAIGRVLDRTREVNGLATILWHPHNLEPRFWKGWDRVPFEAMRLARERGAATGTIGELAGEL